MYSFRFEFAGERHPRVEFELCHRLCHIRQDEEPQSTTPSHCMAVESELVPAEAHAQGVCLPGVPRHVHTVLIEKPGQSYPICTEGWLTPRRTPGVRATRTDRTAHPQ